MRRPAAGRRQSRASGGAQLRLVGLALGALGVVFGDIGTSPLYAVQTVFSIDNGAVKPTVADVYGVVSLIFWSITLVVSVKYVSFILRADNDGEGGIMALAALVRAVAGEHRAAGGVRAGRWASRGVAVLRRLAHHAGDLGAVGGRGPGGGRARSWPRSCCRSASSSSRCCSPSSGWAPTGSGGCSVRSWWCGSWCWPCWACRTSSRTPACCWGSSPTYRVVVRRRSPVHGVHRHGRGRAGRSPAPRRSTPTWATSGGARSGSRGSRVVFPALIINYLGQAALILGRPGGDREPVLPARPGLGAAAAGRAGHRARR